MRPRPDTWCACQWGICGACDGTVDRGSPRHDRCLSRTDSEPMVFPLTWLLDKRGFVTGPALWPATGSPCRYICPCPCPKTGPIQAPARRRPVSMASIAASSPEAGALFDLEGIHA